MVERLDIDVGLTEIPQTAQEAYAMIVSSLSADIEKKTKILTKMLDERVKGQFIGQWHPSIARVNIHV